MRLVRFERDGHPCLGALVEQGVVDLHDLDPVVKENCPAGNMRALLALGEERLVHLRHQLQTVQPGAIIPLGQIRLLAPIANPRKIICAWVNYPNPAAAKLPETPIFFSKYATALIGPEETIVLPRIAGQIVVEPELTAVIGSAGRHIPEADALAHVAGYTITNDVTAFSHRLQVLLGSPGPYMMAKSFDSFAPCGPAIVTQDEIKDPHSLSVRQWRNEVLQTSSNTSQAIFKLPRLISYLSDFFTLEAGDLILTGSPPPDGDLTFLQDGDRIRIEIDQLGSLENPVVSESESA